MRSFDGLSRQEWERAISIVISVKASKYVREMTADHSDELWLRHVSTKKKTRKNKIAYIIYVRSMYEIGTSMNWGIRRSLCGSILRHRASKTTSTSWDGDKRSRL